MSFSPDALEQKRKHHEKEVHAMMVRFFNDWLESWLIKMDAQAYPLPYRISWSSCYAVVEAAVLTEAAFLPVHVSEPAIIFEVLDKYKKDGWKISREEREEGWWIFKKRVDELVFKAQPCQLL